MNDETIPPEAMPTPSFNPFLSHFEMTPMLEIPRRDGSKVGVPISRVIAIDGKNVFVTNANDNVSIIETVMPEEELISEYNRLWALARPNQSGDFMERIGTALLKKLNQGDEWKPE